ncbi:MAG: M56 family metallopeptidase [Bacillota bacterium]|jgi:beta-lactamase regulating signal transducer with metallopeptidase domain|nr:M56 family metallopeptidase [Bacillota bacterium]
MSELFLTVLNMSLTASYVIIFVIFIRLLLKRAPKVISYALWGIVAFRLIIPFSFESMFSLMPRNTSTVLIPHDIIYQQSPQINSGIEVIDLFVSQSFPVQIVGASANPLQVYVVIGAYIWAIGITALLVYSFVSILFLKRQLKSAQLIENNIFEAKNLKTPFVLGLIRPKIYLPDELNATERSYILLHEQTHIYRNDHIIKVFAFLILSIHWFNPLVWIAFMLMSKDMELSCDERVLKQMNNEDIKKPYANSLLSLATGKHILNGSPLAFGEGSVKGRIKNVLNYKKPRFWVIVFSIILVLVVGIGLLSNPIVKYGNDSMNVQTQGPYSMVFLNPFYSTTREAFISARQENEYQFKEDKFEIVSNIKSESISIINPKYEEEIIGDQIIVMGDMTFDVSKYSIKQGYRVITSDGSDTGYIIYKMDNEIWISHWGWYGGNKDAWWCEYILNLTASSMPKLVTGYIVIEDNLLYLDEVEIIRREDTERIAELEELGENITTPSGYHIYNPDTEKQTFEITNETTYNFVDYSFLFLEDGVADRLYTTMKKEEFILHLNESYSDRPPAQKVPFFIEVRDGKVISITEKIEFTI